MNVTRWTLGILVGGMSLGAVAALAAPVPALVPIRAAEAPAAMQQVQYYRHHDDAPWHHRDRYEHRPPHYRHAPPPHGHPYGPPPHPRFYSKEAAKDYVKDYRRAQKDMTKDQIRAWNRAHGL